MNLAEIHVELDRLFVRTQTKKRIQTVHLVPFANQKRLKVVREKLQWRKENPSNKHRAYIDSNL